MQRIMLAELLIMFQLVLEGFELLLIMVELLKLLGSFQLLQHPIGDTKILLLKCLDLRVHRLLI